MVESIEQSKKMLRGWLQLSKARYETAPHAAARAATLKSWIMTYNYVKDTWIKEGRDLDDFGDLVPEGYSEEGSEESKSRSASRDD